MTSGQDTKLALTCSGLVAKVVKPVPEYTIAFEARIPAPPNPLSPAITIAWPKFPLCASCSLNITLSTRSSKSITEQVEGILEKTFFGISRSEY